MGEIDMQRQAPNVGRMRLMGATVVPVTSGDRTLRAACDRRADRPEADQPRQHMGDEQEIVCRPAHGPGVLQVEFHPRVRDWTSRRG